MRVIISPAKKMIVDTDSFEVAVLPVFLDRARRLKTVLHEMSPRELQLLVERFFNRMKQFRRFATRYEKTAKSFLALVHFVAVFVYLSLS